MTFDVVLILSAALISYIGTLLVRSYVIRKDVMDVPNERSSHQTPTPRGGGLAVIFTMTLGVLALIVVGAISTHWLIPLGAALVISLLGWWDDTKGLSAGLRLMVQSAAAVGAILALQIFVFDPWDFAIVQVPISTVPALVFFALFAIWMTNLYNFMDGIDGILGVQTLTVAIGAAILSSRGSRWSDLEAIYLIVAGSAAGFLFLNWSPARIFMGDVGSACLGFFFALLAFVGVANAQVSFVAVVILHAAFIGDATMTLFVRLSRGRKPHQAHRSHVYQKMVQSGFTHASVSLFFAAINILWLLPLAWLVEAQRLNAWVALGLAYAPIVLLGLRFRAGVDAVQAPVR